MSRPGAPRWVIVFAAGLLLLAGGSVRAWSVELPYYAYSPGPVGDALGSVVVDQGVTTYPSDDGLFLLTVAAQEINLFELIAAAADPTVDVVRRERVRPPDLTDEQFRQRGLSQMDQATETAITEALARVGGASNAVAEGVEVVDLLRDDGHFEIGDIVVSIDGMPVKALDDIRVALGDKQVGDEVNVEVVRSGGRLSFRMALIPSPDDASRPLLGIVARTVFPIRIETGNIGGPSAGMMYTLAIIDLLTPGDLAHGRVIAGTGTIQPGGDVGAIGGVRQKVVAAEAAGAEVMLVPKSNYEEALSAPRQSMELVPVANLDEALSYLGSLS